MHYRHALLATALLLTGARTTVHTPPHIGAGATLISTLESGSYTEDRAPTLEQEIAALQSRTFGSAQIMQELVMELNEDIRFTKAEKEPIYQEIREETALLAQVVPFLKKYGVNDGFTSMPLDAKSEQRRAAEYLIAQNAFDEFDKKFTGTLTELTQMERVYELSKNMNKI